jgi:hypothetical protein
LPFIRAVSGACQSERACSAVSQFPRRTPFFFMPLTRRIPGQIGAEQATIGGLISQPPNSAETKIDGPRGQAPRFEMAAIPQNHNAIECQPWF